MKPTKLAQAVARLKACVKEGSGLRAYDVVDREDLRAVLAALEEAQAKYDALIAKIAEGWPEAGPTADDFRAACDALNDERRAKAKGKKGAKR